MSTHNHLLHFKMRNRILNHTRRVDIVGMHRVGNVAVHEYVAGLALANCALREAGVAAAEPEDLRGLALGEVDKGIGVFCGGVLGVQAVEGE
jgi:hypothetical protein